MAFTYGFFFGCLYLLYELFTSLLTRLQQTVDQLPASWASFLLISGCIYVVFAVISRNKSIKTLLYILFMPFSLVHWKVVSDYYTKVSPYCLLVVGISFQVLLIVILPVLSLTSEIKLWLALGSIVILPNLAEIREIYDSRHAQAPVTDFQLAYGFYLLALFTICIVAVLLCGMTLITLLLIFLGMLIFTTIYKKIVLTQELTSKIRIQHSPQQKMPEKAVLEYFVKIEDN